MAFEADPGDVIEVLMKSCVQLFKATASISESVCEAKAEKSEKLCLQLVPNNKTGDVKDPGTREAEKSIDASLLDENEDSLSETFEADIHLLDSSSDESEVLVNEQSRDSTWSDSSSGSQMQEFGSFDSSHSSFESGKSHLEDSQGNNNLIVSDPPTKMDIRSHINRKPCPKSKRKKSDDQSDRDTSLGETMELVHSAPGGPVSPSPVFIQSRVNGYHIPGMASDTSVEPISQRTQSPSPLRHGFTNVRGHLSRREEHTLKLRRELRQNKLEIESALKITKHLRVHLERLPNISPVNLSSTSVVAPEQPSSEAVNGTKPAVAQMSSEKPVLTLVNESGGKKKGVGVRKATSRKLDVSPNQPKNKDVDPSVEGTSGRVTPSKTSRALQAIKPLVAEVPTKIATLEGPVKDGDQKNLKGPEKGRKTKVSISPTQPSSRDTDTSIELTSGGRTPKNRRCGSAPASGSAGKARKASPSPQVLKQKKGQKPVHDTPRKIQASNMLLPKSKKSPGIKQLLSGQCSPVKRGTEVKPSSAPSERAEVRSPKAGRSKLEGPTRTPVVRDAVLDTIDLVIGRRKEAGVESDTPTDSVLEVIDIVIGRIPDQSRSSSCVPSSSPRRSCLVTTPRRRTKSVSFDPSIPSPPGTPEVLDEIVDISRPISPREGSSVSCDTQSTESDLVQSLQTIEITCESDTSEHEKLSQIRKIVSHMSSNDGAIPTQLRQLVILDFDDDAVVSIIRVSVKAMLKKVVVNTSPSASPAEPREIQQSTPVAAKGRRRCSTVKSPEPIRSKSVPSNIVSQKELVRPQSTSPRPCISPKPSVSEHKLRSRRSVSPLENSFRDVTAGRTSPRSPSGQESEKSASSRSSPTACKSDRKESVAIPVNRNDLRSGTRVSSVQEMHDMSTVGTHPTLPVIVDEAEKGQELKLSRVEPVSGKGRKSLAKKDIVPDKTAAVEKEKTHREDHACTVSASSFSEVEGSLVPSTSDPSLVPSQSTTSKEVASTAIAVEESATENMTLLPTSYAVDSKAGTPRERRGRNLKSNLKGNLPTSSAASVVKGDGFDAEGVCKVQELPLSETLMYPDLTRRSGKPITTRSRGKASNTQKESATQVASSHSLTLETDKERAPEKMSATKAFEKSLASEEVQLSPEKTNEMIGEIPDKTLEKRKSQALKNLFFRNRNRSGESDLMNSQKSPLPSLESTRDSSLKKVVLPQTENDRGEEGCEISVEAVVRTSSGLEKEEGDIAPVTAVSGKMDVGSTSRGTGRRGRGRGLPNRRPESASQLPTSEAISKGTSFEVVRSKSHPSVTAGGVSVKAGVVDEALASSTIQNMLPSPRVIVVDIVNSIEEAAAQKLFENESLSLSRQQKKKQKGKPQPVLTDVPVTSPMPMLTFEPTDDVRHPTLSCDPSEQLDLVSSQEPKTNIETKSKTGDSAKQQSNRRRRRSSGYVGKRRVRKSASNHGLQPNGEDGSLPAGTGSISLSPVSHGWVTSQELGRNDQQLCLPSVSKLNDKTDPPAPLSSGPAGSNTNPSPKVKMTKRKRRGTGIGPSSKMPRLQQDEQSDISNENPIQVTLCSETTTVPKEFTRENVVPPSSPRTLSLENFPTPEERVIVQKNEVAHNQLLVLVEERCNRERPPTSSVESAQDNQIADSETIESGEHVDEFSSCSSSGSDDQEIGTQLLSIDRKLFTPCFVRLTRIKLSGSLKPEIIDSLAAQSRSLLKPVEEQSALVKEDRQRKRSKSEKSERSSSDKRHREEKSHRRESTSEKKHEAKRDEKSAREKTSQHSEREKSRSSDHKSRHRDKRRKSSNRDTKNEKDQKSSKDLKRSVSESSHKKSEKPITSQDVAENYHRFVQELAKQGIEKIPKRKVSSNVNSPVSPAVSTANLPNGLPQSPATDLEDLPGPTVSASIKKPVPAAPKPPERPQHLPLESISVSKLAQKIIREKQKNQTKTEEGPLLEPLPTSLDLQPLSVSDSAGKEPVIFVPPPAANVFLPDATSLFTVESAALVEGHSTARTPSIGREVAKDLQEVTRRLSVNESASQEHKEPDPSVALEARQNGPLQLDHEDTGNGLDPNRSPSSTGPVLFHSDLLLCGFQASSGPQSPSDDRWLIGTRSSSVSDCGDDTFRSIATSDLQLSLVEINSTFGQISDDNADLGSQEFRNSESCAESEATTIPFGEKESEEKGISEAFDGGTSPLDANEPAAATKIVGKVASPADVDEESSSDVDQQLLDEGSRGDSRVPDGSRNLEPGRDGANTPNLGASQEESSLPPVSRDEEILALTLAETFTPIRKENQTLVQVLNPVEAAVVEDKPPRIHDPNWALALEQDQVPLDYEYEPETEDGELISEAGDVGERDGLSEISEQSSSGLDAVSEDEEDLDIETEGAEKPTSDVEVQPSDKRKIEGKTDKEGASLKESDDHKGEPSVVERHICIDFLEFGRCDFGETCPRRHDIDQPGILVSHMLDHYWMKETEFCMQIWRLAKGKGLLQDIASFDQLIAKNLGKKPIKVEKAAFLSLLEYISGRDSDQHAEEFENLVFGLYNLYIASGEIHCTLITSKLLEVAVKLKMYYVVEDYLEKITRKEMDVFFPYPLFWKIIETLSRYVGNSEISGIVSALVRLSDSFLKTVVQKQSPLRVFQLKLLLDEHVDPPIAIKKLRETFAIRLRNFQRRGAFRRPNLQEYCSKQKVLYFLPPDQRRSLKRTSPTAEQGLLLPEISKQKLLPDKELPKMQNKIPALIEVMPVVSKPLPRLEPGPNRSTSQTDSDIVQRLQQIGLLRPEPHESEGRNRVSKRLRTDMSAYPNMPGPSKRPVLLPAPLVPCKPLTRSSSIPKGPSESIGSAFSPENEPRTQLLQLRASLKGSVQTPVGPPVNQSTPSEEFVPYLHQESPALANSVPQSQRQIPSATPLADATETNIVTPTRASGDRLLRPRPVPSQPLANTTSDVRPTGNPTTFTSPSVQKHLETDRAGRGPGLPSADQTVVSLGMSLIGAGSLLQPRVDIRQRLGSLEDETESSRNTSARKLISNLRLSGEHQPKQGRSSENIAMPFSFGKEATRDHPQSNTRTGQPNRSSSLEKPEPPHPPVTCSSQSTSRHPEYERAFINITVTAGSQRLARISGPVQENVPSLLSLRFPGAFGESGSTSLDSDEHFQGDLQPQRKKLRVSDGLSTPTRTEHSVVLKRPVLSNQPLSVGESPRGNTVPAYQTPTTAARTANVLTSSSSTYRVVDGKVVVQAPSGGRIVPTRQRPAVATERRTSVGEAASPGAGAGKMVAQTPPESSTKPASITARRTNAGESASTGAGVGKEKMVAQTPSGSCTKPASITARRTNVGESACAGGGVGKEKMVAQTPPESCTKPATITSRRTNVGESASADAGVGVGNEKMVVQTPRESCSKPASITARKKNADESASAGAGVGKEQAVVQAPSRLRTIPTHQTPEVCVETSKDTNPTEPIITTASVVSQQGPLVSPVAASSVPSQKEVIRKRIVQISLFANPKANLPVVYRPPDNKVVSAVTAGNISFLVQKITSGTADTKFYSALVSTLIKTGQYSTGFEALLRKLPREFLKSEGIQSLCAAFCLELCRAKQFQELFKICGVFRALSVRYLESDIKSILHTGLEPSDILLEVAYGIAKAGKWKAAVNVLDRRLSQPSYETALLSHRRCAAVAEFLSASARTADGAETLTIQTLDATSIEQIMSNTDASNVFVTVRGKLQNQDMNVMKKQLATKYDVMRLFLTSKVNGRIFVSRK